MIETLKEYPDYISTTAEINAAYVLIQKGTNLVYVGSSGKPGMRVSRHMTLLKGQHHDNVELQQAYNLNPTFEPVYYVVKTREEAYQLEQALVDRYHPTGKLLNIGLDVRAPNRGRVASDETRQRQREAAIGRVISDETRQKLSEANKGIVRTEEQKKLLSELKKGKPQPEHIAELCRERNRLRSKPVVINGINYPSVREAARILNMHRDNVKTRLKSNNPKYSEWVATITYFFLIITDQIPHLRRHGS